MINILKRKPAQGYSKKILRIHREFATAGDALLQEVKKGVPVVPSHSTKAVKLREFGFSRVKEVENANIERDEKKELALLYEAVESLSQQCPQYRFLRPATVLEICRKYDLYVGFVDQYTGFVPQKNLDEIAKFFATAPDGITHDFRKTWRGSTIFGSDEGRLITQEEYEAGIAAAAVKGSEYSLYRRDDFSYTKTRKNLLIAAPLKDMNRKGYTLKDRIFSRPAPDPVVMVEVLYKSVQLNCIITAWGDEASDENIVNHKMN